MNQLTLCIMAAILNPLKHFSTGLVSCNVAAQPQTCGFFVRKISSSSYYGGLDRALARVAGCYTGRPTLFSLPPNDWSHWWWVYNLPE
ncbi:hypothetical protein [Methylobacter psychrophilus]|uniref:hypothetical protein n=1 Tax=Methylobacter psychrophilus TaxID=96941 RepID=UPI0021D4BC77|nr:hypothetical protein [Methylobacter psychrophilus]